MIYGINGIIQSKNFNSVQKVIPIINRLDKLISSRYLLISIDKRETNTQSAHDARITLLRFNVLASWQRRPYNVFLMLCAGWVTRQFLNFMMLQQQ